MSIRDAGLKFYWKAQRVLAPGLSFAHSVYDDVLMELPSTGKVWLDLGCGHHLLQPWRFDEEAGLVKRARLVVGLDYDEPSLRKHQTIRARVRGSVSNLPLDADSIDLVTSNMVFEHLEEPERQLSEVFRVLRPGGLLAFHTPNALGYSTQLAKLAPESLKSKLIWLLERRKPEDVFPTFYRANSPAAIDQLAGRVGFSVVDLRFIATHAMSAPVPPLAVVELLFIRVLMLQRFRRWRPNLIAILQKPAGTAPARHQAAGKA